MCKDVGGRFNSAVKEEMGLFTYMCCYHYSKKEAACFLAIVCSLQCPENEIFVIASL